MSNQEKRFEEFKERVDKELKIINTAIMAVLPNMVEIQIEIEAGIRIGLSKTEMEKYVYEGTVYIDELIDEQLKAIKNGKRH